MVLTGKEAKLSAYDKRVLSLLQQTTTLTETNTTTTDDTTPGVVTYIAPNGLIGILFMLGMFSIMIMGFLLLFYVQTPTVFTSESIDFGKIEK
jgi:hypothetical protein